MRIGQPLADQILERAKGILDRTVLVADAQGLVQASQDYTGQIMVDALRSCQEGKIVRSFLGESQIAWCPFVYDGQTVGAFGIIEGNEGPITPEAISLLQGLAEVITHQYFLMRHIQPSATVRAKFFKQVLTTARGSHTETYRQADVLQLNLRMPQAIILIEINGFQEGIRSQLGSISADEQELKIAQAADDITQTVLGAFNNHPGNICCYLGGDTFVLSKGIGGEGLTIRNTMRFLIEKAEYVYGILKKQYPDKTVSLGVGQYYPDLGGLRKSYQEAKLSLHVGTKVWGNDTVYHIKSVGMFVTLANVTQERKAELAHQILYPLLKDEQLYKTVRTFLTSGLNLTEAAGLLHVHRNTLIYRLDKTKKVIGLDPRVFDDALQIKLGLMFYQDTEPESPVLHKA
ncbi:MAG TPA: helix-turn-helix domain-containing protein [Candidatus Dormibacteraeota bacterium]|nr:helix-turn-helix domain-containing protein [Candidatus Dormibacteraeota bacterium]